MSILVYRDRSAAAAAAATLIAAQVIEKPSGVFGFDYARELVPAYRELVRMTDEGLLDWSDTRAFVLSENVQRDAGSSVSRTLKERFFDRVGQPEEKRFVPETGRADWNRNCSDYEEAILREGGIDLAFVSVRQDGGVVNNYPAQELSPVTHVERTPEGRIVTIGITTLMTARKLVVLMTGADKAEIAPQVFHGPVLPGVPAGYLQMHGHVVFLLDEEAAERL